MKLSASEGSDSAHEAIKYVNRKTLEKFRVIVGFVLIVSGLIGFMLPFVPGTALLAAGVALVGSGHPVIQAWIKRLKQWQKSLLSTLSYYKEALWRTKT